MIQFIFLLCITFSALTVANQVEFGPSKNSLSDEEIKYRTAYIADTVQEVVAESNQVNTIKMSVRQPAPESNKLFSTNMILYFVDSSQNKVAVPNLSISNVNNYVYFTASVTRTDLDGGKCQTFTDDAYYGWTCRFQLDYILTEVNQTALSLHYSLTVKLIRTTSSTYYIGIQKIDKTLCNCTILERYPLITMAYSDRECTQVLNNNVIEYGQTVCLKVFSNSQFVQDFYFNRESFLITYKNANGEYVSDIRTSLPEYTIEKGLAKLVFRAPTVGTHIYFTTTITLGRTKNRMLEEGGELEGKGLQSRTEEFKLGGEGIDPCLNNDSEACFSPSSVTVSVIGILLVLIAAIL